MPKVLVVENKGKFNVLINFIQEGISYSSRELAEKEAKKIKAKYENIYLK